MDDEEIAGTGHGWNFNLYVFSQFVCGITFVPGTNN